MQFAQVVVNTKTALKNQFFTYKIPPSLLAEIKIGCLVEVPFRNKMIEGIVWQLVKQSKFEKLKSIKKIITPEVIANNFHRELAVWMSQYYLEPLGKCLFTILPPIPKRYAAKIPTIRDIEIFNNSTTYFFQGNRQERFNLYRKIVSKNLNDKIVVLFSSQNQLNKFKKYLLNYQNINFHENSPTSKKRFNQWFEILTRKPKLILGTRATIFDPIFNPKYIIIDEISGFSYKQEQSPRYHAATIATKIAEMSKSKLILADELPSAEIYQKIIEKKYRLLRIKSTHKIFPSIKIIDLKSQKNFISFPLQENITAFLKQNKKILLYVNRKGQGSNIICQDCKTIKLCPNCNLPLVAHLNDRKYRCHQCQYWEKENAKCLKCAGTNTYYSGLGDEKIKEIAQKMFGKTKNISIGTKQILETDQKFDLVAVINLDNILNLPNPYSKEEVFRTIFRLKNIAKERLIIQTYLPKNYVFQNLNQPFNFLINELSLRKQFGLPPFRKIIKLILQNPDEKTAKQKIENLAKELINFKEVELLGPNKKFIPQKRNQFLYQLVIKLPKDQNVFSLFSKLKKFTSNFKVDVDPIELI